jgi:hypothetical protein
LKILALVLLVAAVPLSAATVRNDDSCDIGLYPAATLLLPFFEVDLYRAGPDGPGETTLVTVTNVSNVPQAARVTLWTDFAYPVLSFNLFLTGYDVQSVDLYEVIHDGILPGNASADGDLSRADNQRLSEDTCTGLPTQLPQPLIARMIGAFTTGKIPGACNTAGSPHVNATGYATIDVVGACTGTIPTDRNYFTHEIRFDNVLAGDYVQVTRREDMARANPLVHIRAIPEGGEASTRARTNLSRTFYSHLQRGPHMTLDGRQPLPATFAARWVQGGWTGMETTFKIWRETATTADTLCSAYPATLRSYEVVRFDEDEKPESFEPSYTQIPIPPSPVLLATSRVDSDSAAFFPTQTSGTVGGWMYFNLDNGKHDTIASQNWVVVSMQSEDRFSSDAGAVSLGNGCTPVRALTEKHWWAPEGSPPIGPAPNVNP